MPSRALKERVCPSCNRSTKVIRVERQTPDYVGLLFGGALAVFFPHRESGSACEHCDEIFDCRPTENRMANRLVGMALLVICLSVFFAVVIMLASV